LKYRVFEAAWPDSAHDRVATARSTAAETPPSQPQLSLRLRSLSCPEAMTPAAVGEWCLPGLFS